MRDRIFLTRDPKRERDERPFRTGVAALFLFVFSGMSLLPESAWALQTHGAPEGLITHQLAHVLFALSMGVLAYWLESNHFIRARGWRLIQLSCVLFLIWNLVAFSGHFAEGLLPPDLILGPKGSWNQQLLMDGGSTAMAYYSLKLDHLVCVPAIVCLFFGIRSLYLQTVTEAARSE